MSDFKSQFPTPSPTVVTGVRATSDIVAGRIKLDVSDEIFQYDPNANSLTLLLTKARKKRSVTQYLYNWLEKDRYPRFDAVNLAAGYDENDVSIVVDDGSKFYANALILNTRTNERMLVTDVSSNTLTVTRNLGGTGSAINDNDQLEILTSAYVEGGDVGTSKSVQERMIEQFTQTIRTPYSFTGRDMNTDMYGGKDPNTERRWQGVEHAVSIEKAFWWSTKGSTTDATSGKLITYMNGVHSYVKDNVWDINGIPFTERAFTEWLEYSMRYGSGGKMGSRTKYLFCAPRFITEVESWAKDKLYYQPSDKMFGIDSAVYRSAHGKIFMVEHPLFEERGDIAFLLDLNHVRYVYHQGRDTSLLKDRGGNGVDGETEEYLSDVSVQVELSAAHGFLRNLPL